MKAPVISPQFERGFSLVELSIVLVILGLLTGGILGGQSLINAAALRSVSTDYQRFSAAANTFRDKYFAYPGDLRNATAFWGKDNTNCAGDTGTAATPGTCNGDGNGVVGIYGASAEYTRYWQHLALAGLIEGTYTGICTTVDWGICAPGPAGSVVPASKFNNGAFFIFQLSLDNSVNGEFAYSDAPLPFEPMLIFSSPSATTFFGPRILKPDEAWNLDTKMDDGKPGTGRFVSGTAGGNCVGGDGTMAGSTYNLQNNGPSCYFATYLQR